MTKTDVMNLLEKKPDFKTKLFERGFFFTDDTIDDQTYPFYGRWNRRELLGFSMLVSPEQTSFVYSKEHEAYILVGHAYDPVRMVSGEDAILRDLSGLWHQEEGAFWERLCDLSGNFTLLRIFDGGLMIVGDATGMQTTFYCRKDGHTYVSSHANCIGDLLGLTWDPYIQRLASYRFFHLFGNSLPGDLTQFTQVKRLVPNHYICLEKGQFVSHRFYWPAKKQVTNEEIAEQVSRLLNNSMNLIARKWEKPAISMTGGCDSKTTLACAKGYYDSFRYYSYISSDSEKVDAEAAHKICENMGLKHTTHVISEDDAAFQDAEIVRALIFWNAGGISLPNKNDVRKRCYFMKCSDFDVEVKSWASEIGRAYYSKRFAGRTNFGPKPTPRKCTTMYKVFFHNRRLVRDTDRVFADYLNRFFEQAKENPVEWQEQFFWEFRVASWNGLVITGEHSITDTIVIPYNNRRILELLLSAPIEDRVSDAVYSEIRQKMNPEVDAKGIAVTNMKHTSRRAKVENGYYSVHSFLHI